MKHGVKQGDERYFTPKPVKALPHAFVLDALVAQSRITPVTRPMFGCIAVYVGPKIVLILRDKRDGAQHDGVWLATSADHHESLRCELPNMEPVEMFGPVTSWQILRTESPDFEEAAMRVCELIAMGDPRIGRIPKAKRKAKKTSR